MIIKLLKHLFIGPSDQLKAFFTKAQEMGLIEFISKSKKEKKGVAESSQILAEALKILRKIATPEQLVCAEDPARAEQMAREIIALKMEGDAFHEEKRRLSSEIAHLEPFGNFSLDEVKKIEAESGYRAHFFCLKAGDSIDFPEATYITTEYDLDYYVAFSKTPLNIPKMVEVRFEKSVPELKDRLLEVKHQILEKEQQIKQHGKYQKFLHAALLESIDIYSLTVARKNAKYALQDQVFAVEGWVRKDQIQQLQALLEEFPIYAEEISIDEGESIPTCMKNEGVSHLGEDLVQIYDTPSWQDKDPSGWVFWSFALFFAMIIGDGGYGLVFFALALFLKYKFPTIKGSGKRFLKLFTYLSVGCIAWGVFTSSFFGLQSEPGSPTSKFSLMGKIINQKAQYHLKEKDDVYDTWVKEIPKLSHVKSGSEFVKEATRTREHKTLFVVFEEFNQNVMLELSLLIGVVHLMVSLLRYSGGNFAAFGWILFLIGGYLYFPSVLSATSFVHFFGIVSKQTSQAVGLPLLFTGIGGAVLLAIIQRGLKGIGEITKLIEVFADVLSYLRLYALGLAGALMASTFNEMGSDAGLFFGSIIVLLGHIVNISLSTMSGVVHGLRLNFIEWYHYSFIGGGRLFKPLKKQKQS